MTWHAFLTAPDEPFLTIPHGQLALLPLSLPLIEYSTDAKLVFLDSCLRFYEVCLLSANMHVIINDVFKWHGMQNVWKMWNVWDVFAWDNPCERKLHLFQRTKFVYIQDLIYPKSITVIEIDTLKAGASRSSARLSLLRISMWSVRIVLLSLQ